MATMPLDTWVKYKNLLAKISDEAAKEFRDAVFNVNGRFGGVGLGQIDRDELSSSLMLLLQSILRHPPRQLASFMMSLRSCPVQWFLLQCLLRQLIYQQSQRLLILATMRTL